MIHFYHHPMSPYSQKIFFLFEELEETYDLQMIELEKKQQRSADYTSVSPAGRVPAIKDGDFCLSESNAIMHYLARKFERYDLMPLGLREQAEIEMWSEFCSHHINKPMMDIVWHRFLIAKFGGKPDHAVIAKAERLLARDLPVLEHRLLGRNYLCGPSLTLADINLMPFAHSAPMYLPMDQFPSFKRWRELVSERQAWRNVVAYSG